ncbi:MAG: CYTH domain-containing protein [Streptococcaceae bacterium]|jgi:uncharacterized protein YjbK|nr:CYTH domain-containing protein [Streptococcaceae bacterium]
MENLEIEFKTLLTQIEYLRLLEAFNVTSFSHQTNVYFDTAKGALKAHGLALRIRFYSDTTEITLKVPQLHGHLEINLPLNLKHDELQATTDYFAETEIATHLKIMGIATEDLVPIAKLTTKRAEKKLDIGLLALDESWYNQTRDYELELEVDDYDSGKLAFTKLLSQHQITYQKAAPKIARAINNASLS